MTEMDRPDGLHLMRVAAGVGLAVLFAIATLVGFAGKAALLRWATIDVGDPGGGDYQIAGVLTAITLIAGIARWRGVVRVRMWMLTVLAGLTCGAWIAALLVGGGAIG